MNSVGAIEDKLSLGYKEVLNSSEFQLAFSFYRQHIPYRNDALFLEFLPKGYLATTLNSVQEERSRMVVVAKIHLGMLITLYDDFADNPALLNHRLLEELYKVPFAMDQLQDQHFDEKEKGVLKLGSFLGQQLLACMNAFPHYQVLCKFFEFDLTQFYQANRFAQLLTTCPSAANRFELALYGPHNMGMVAAGVIDLMASDYIDMQELGTIRTVFSYGQRLGRICNVLTTYERELSEGDITNELKVMNIESTRGAFHEQGKENGSLDKNRSHSLRSILEKERTNLFARIIGLAPYVKSFNVHQYVNGLRYLQELHEGLIHKI